MTLQLSHRILDTVQGVWVNARVEIIVLVFAVVAHSILFGNVPTKLQSLRLGFRTRKKQEEVNLEASQSRRNSLVRTLDPLLKANADEDAIFNELQRKLGNVAEDVVLDVLAQFFEEAGASLSPQLFRGARRLVSERQLSLKGRMGVLLVRGCTNLSLQKDFEEILGEVTAQKAGSAALALVVLKGAIGWANVGYGLACLPWFAGAGTVSPTTQALLQQLVQLAVRNSAFPALLKELRKWKLLQEMQSTKLYNTLLGACLACKDSASAEELAADACEGGFADVVTFNALIKARVHAKQLKKACDTVSAMQSFGVQPSIVTFNELLDATVTQSAPSSSACWHIVAELDAHGFKPNLITCSTLLKSVQPGVDAAHVRKVMALVDEVCSDEVVFSSALEACMRVNRHDLLSQLLRRYRSEGRIQLHGAHAYGSLIRAHGFCKDVRGARATFQEMKDRGIATTSITLGCVVEALASNGAADAAYELVRDLMADAEGRQTVNAVVYCSILKGFSHQKRFSRVWEVYEEMLANGLQRQFTDVTYNTIIDACVRSGEIGRSMSILEEMERQGITVSIVTYSVILKGYCRESKLDQAFELLEFMKRTEHTQPDEQTYNTIMDGCSRAPDLRRGLDVFREMEARGVCPSNFTLCILAKLASRCKRLDMAFSLVEEVTTKYSLRPNMHVYNSLIHGCVIQKNFQRGLSTFELMLGKGEKPDSRTYSLFLRGLTYTTHTYYSMDAVTIGAIIRASVGLPVSNGPAWLASAGALATPKDGPPSTSILEAALQALAQFWHEPTLAMEVLKELKQVDGVSIDSQQLVLQLIS